MLRKQLGLIVAMLLPVSVLIVGFLVTRAHAWLVNGSYANETASPAACGDSYRVTFANDASIGLGERPHNPAYCPPNALMRASESASFSSSWFNDDHIHWYRSQLWTFNAPMAWGTTQCQITRNEEIHYSWFSGGYWDGTEASYRFEDEDTDVYMYADNRRWIQKVVNGIRYRCPRYRLYNPHPTWFDCLDPNEATQHHYNDDQIYDRDYDPDNYMKYPGDALQAQGQSGQWYDCIAWVM